MPGHGHEVLLGLVEAFALGDVADGGDHGYALSIADEEVRTRLHDALATIRALHAGLVGARWLRISERGAVPRPRLVAAGLDRGQGGLLRPLGSGSRRR